MDIFALFKQIEGEKQEKKAITNIIVGLGNPGEKYALTRHNTGFLALDYISQKCSVKIDRVKFSSLCTECEIGDKRVLLMQPQTFMNESGRAVKQAADFYKIDPANIVVIFDDISLDVGKMRIRKKGSDGGHNGIKSIVANLGSSDFPRIKVGIGAKPNPEYDLADWVLSKFTKEEQKTLFEKFENVFDAVKLMLSGKTDQAMNLYNN